MSPTTSVGSPGASPGGPGTLPIDDLGDGLALVGPAAERRAVLHALMRERIRAGSACAALSIGQDAGLVDAAGEAAAGAGRDIAVVDPDAGAALTHGLDPFGEPDADAILRLALAASPLLAEDTLGASRARTLVRAAAGAAVDLREQGLLDVSPRLLLDFLDLRRLVDLADPDRYPGLDGSARDAVGRYLRGLPGYQAERLYRQPPPVHEAHAAAAGIAEDAFGWLARGRYGALAAGPAAGVSLADIAQPGTAVAMRAPHRPGEGAPAPFLLACLCEGLRRRADPDPVLVVIDGADALPTWQLGEIAALRGPGVELAVGLSDLRAGPRAALALELGARLLLPGAGGAALDALAVPDHARAVHAHALAAWSPLLLREDECLAFAAPSLPRPPRRGPVQARTPVGTRTRPALAEPPPDDVVERLSAIAAGEALPPERDGDPVIDTLAGAFARRAHGTGIDAAARGAVLALAGEDAGPADAGRS